MATGLLAAGADDFRKSRPLAEGIGKPLRFDIGSFEAAHRGLKHWPNVVPNFSPDNGCRLAQCRRMFATHNGYIRIVITFDELLSNDFEALAGQSGDADLAARRLAAWCRSCASGDWSLFGRRLQRDQPACAQRIQDFAASRSAGG